MIVVIFLGLFSILFAFLESSGLYKSGLKVSFSLIFIFLALRYNFGNDYQAYYTGFLEISSNVKVDYINNSDHFEVGWIFFNWLFRHIGFFAMIAVLASINCVVYYRFIKKYVPTKYYWLAVFFYIFNPGFMLIHASAMRQSIAIAIFIFSLNYIHKRDLIRYVITISVASLFHSSALILYLVYFLNLVSLKNKGTRVVFFVTFVALFLFQKSLLPYLNILISNYFDKYEIYQEAGVVGTGLGILYLSTLLILLLYYGRLQDKETGLIFNIAVISFLFIPLSLFIEIIGRVGMYFQVATLIAYPVTLFSIKKIVYRKSYVAILVFMTIYTFFQFFYSSVYKDGYGSFHTIFSSGRWY